MRTAPGGRSSRCFPGDPNYGLCNTATNPSCLNIIPAARMDPIAQQIASHIPANNIDRASRNYFSQGPFESDRRQVDTKIDYNVNSKFNLAGTFGLLHFNTSVPTIFGEEAIGRPIGGSSNPGKGHGNIVPDHRDGHLHFQPDVPHGRTLWICQAGDELGAAGPRHEHRERRAGHSGHQRHAPLRERLAHVRVRGLRHGRCERELHAVLPARSAVAVRRELQPDEEGAQHSVRRRLLSHGVEPCAGGVHHGRLRRAGRLRVRPRHHGAVRGRRSGVGQLPADLRRLPLQQRGSVRARPGQPRRQNAAGAGRVQRAGRPLQLLRPRPVDHRRQPHGRLRHAVGVLPASDPTRPRHRAVRRHHQQGAALRDRRHTHRLRHQGEQDALRPARGHGLSHRRHHGRARGLRPDQRSVLWDRDRSGELPDPDAAQPRIAQRPDAGGDAGRRDSRDYRARSGQWHHRHPEQLCVGGLSARAEPRVHPVVEFHRPAGAAVEVHGPDRVRGHALDTAARAQRHQCRPGHRRRRGRPAPAATVRPDGVHRVPAARRHRGSTTRCRRSCIGGSPTASA